MAAETGRVATDNPVAPGVELAAAWNDETTLLTIENKCKRVSA